MGTARTDNGCGEGLTARGTNLESSMAQQVQTAGSCKAFVSLTAPRR
jgi:hypothetical protein